MADEQTVEQNSYLFDFVHNKKVRVCTYFYKNKTELSNTYILNPIFRRSKKARQFKTKPISEYAKHDSHLTAANHTKIDKNHNDILLSEQHQVPILFDLKALIMVSYNDR